jgi:tetratricopeptide (TPR) repeat protein
MDVTGDELKMIAKELGVPMSKADVKAALLAMDENGDNEIEFEEFRDWWVLQSSQPTAGDGGAMGVFKRKLAESTARTVMEFDWATFAQLCKECNLLGKQDLKSRRINPAGALLSPSVQFAFRKALHEDYDPAEEAHAEAERARKRKGVLSKKDEELEQQRKDAWKVERMRFDPFFVAMSIIAAEMFEESADAILQMDKLIRRIETSGGSRAAKWFDRAEQCFAVMAYEDALKDFNKAISLDDTSCKYFSSRAGAKNAPPFSLNFPYVCPEPVLAK